MPRSSNILEIVINGTNNAGKVFKRAGAQMVKFGAIATAALTGAAVRAGQFERGMAEISTLLDGEVTDSMERMRGQLLDMSVQFGQTIGDMTKARYDIISAGFTDAGESAMILEAAAKLAVAGVSDVASTADLLTTALNGMGLEASQSEAVADVLFQTVRKGKTTMTDLAASMGPLFATARTAGVSLKELGAFMATTTAAGIDTRESVTAMNQVMLALAAPTGAAGKKLRDLGITLDDGVEPALRALAEVGEDGIAALSALIPNIRALKAAAVAASDIEGLHDNMVAMDEAVGVVDEGFAKMAETFDFRSKQARASMDALVITVGNHLLPAFTNMITRVTRVVEVVRENKDAVFEFSTQLFQMSIKVVQIGFTMLALAKVFTLVKIAVAGLNKQTAIAMLVFAGLIASLYGGRALFKAVGVDLDLVAMAQGGVSSAMEKLKEDFPILGQLMEAATGAMVDLADETERTRKELADLAGGNPPTIVADLKTDAEELQEFRKEMGSLAEFTREDVASMAFAFGNDLGNSIASVTTDLIGLTDTGISLGDAIKSMAAGIIGDFARIGARILIAKAMLKAFNLEAGLVGIGAGAATGNPLALLGGVLGLFGARGGKARNAALGARITGGGLGGGLGGGMLMPGTAGLDRTLVLAGGGEMFTPAATVNHAERMLKKTLSSPRRARRARRGITKIEMRVDRPFRREEQLRLRDSVNEADRKSKRFRS